MAQLDVIKKFMSTLNVHTFNSSTNDGTNYSPSKAMLDEAIKASTHYNGIDDAISSFLSDMQNSTSLDEAFGKCGIDTTNSDTGAITGYDVNPKNPVKTQDTIVLEIGNLYRAAMYSDRQIINTGDNGWLVEATSFNDTINSGGEDSINAGAGNDVINWSARRKLSRAAIPTRFPSRRTGMSKPSASWITFPVKPSFWARATMIRF